MSLVVCTRNRAEQLRRMLGTLADVRTSHRWEVVIVENACSDHTGEVVAEFAGRTDLPVRRVQEPVPGLGRARNTGCEAASGEVLALIDDDCYPEPGYVDAVLHVFATHDVGFIGGRVLRYDPSDAEFTVRKAEYPELLPDRMFPPAGFIMGANMAVRRAVFDDIGGFAEDLGAGTPFPCEDIEFCARASDHGWRGGYFPGPTVYHHHGRKPGPDIDDLSANYDRGRGAYYAKVLLDLPSLRLQCLKWWYWDFKFVLPGKSLREIHGCVQYLMHRVKRRIQGASDD